MVSVISARVRDGDLNEHIMLEVLRYLNVTWMTWWLTGQRVSIWVSTISSKTCVKRRLSIRLALPKNCFMPQQDRFDSRGIVNQLKQFVCCWWNSDYLYCGWEPKIFFHMRLTMLRVAVLEVRASNCQRKSKYFKRVCLRRNLKDSWQLTNLLLPHFLSYVLVVFDPIMSPAFFFSRTFFSTLLDTQK